MNKHKPNYGIDAPNVVRNLFLFSLVAFILSIFSFQIQTALWFWILFLYTFPTCLALFATGCWMLYSTKILKPKIALKIIRNLSLTGSEKALDIGCGRGLLLCEIAKHLPHGEVHGIDMWTQDQSGNTPEKTLENADRDNVKARVSIHTGDVRALPFPENTFDAVVSSLCLHNVKDKKEREKALLEMLRILKPGGKFAIADIHRSQEYREFLTAQGIQVKYSKPSYFYCPPITIIEGRKP